MYSLRMYLRTFDRTSHLCRLDRKCCALVPIFSSLLSSIKAKLCFHEIENPVVDGVKSMMMIVTHSLLTLSVSLSLSLSLSLFLPPSLHPSAAGPLLW